MNLERKKEERDEGGRKKEGKRKGKSGEEGGEGRRRDCFTLMFGRNQHNTVKQLSFNKK